ncbi:MAG: tRNA uridine-5-carboxymethylaminomethyl(34) synthesis enzyme MnmG [Nitrospiraceae bacterium]|nr:tRNA uridine-5-carboxymethylaminomethyl(34) synthesis enzyme MnmG [Nitrospiraceae bacterium]
MSKEQDYDVIVVGAGHAGCEAALAAARLGMNTCLFTMNLDTIAQLSCNPAIGGLAKGHLVREIDALGGQMAVVTDKSGIQFRMLNLSKGPAVWSLRAQADRVQYRTHMKQSLESQQGLSVKQDSVEKLIVEGSAVKGIITGLGLRYNAKAVVITTGTFLNGLIHIGLETFPAGRAWEFPSVGLSASLREAGFSMGRLKTGTPPRIDARTIDFSKTTAQFGDDPAVPFSHSTEKIINQQLPCYITYTNAATHKAIMDNLDRSPLYSKKIQGIGPRYCPSIEDKVVRFADKERHQVFLEPEGLNTAEYYANGISTSLPVDVQQKIVNSIPGLEEAFIMRPAYAIEYDFVYPTQLRHTLESKTVQGLYMAGQINGTSGYEEAASLGLMAGINAALKIKNEPELVLARDEAYIGVLIDDLVTKGTKEPYRMFTSRAEYRLLLRHDNADFRLMKKGRSIGLVTEEAYSRFEAKKEIVNTEIQRLRKVRVKPSAELNAALSELGTTAIPEDITLEKLLKRPEIGYAFIKKFSPSDIRIEDSAARLIEINIKYEGYIQKQIETAERMKKVESKKIPAGFDYSSMPGLSTEVRQKLVEVQPETIGQASRIPGITPAAVAILLVSVEKLCRSRQ